MTMYLKMIIFIVLEIVAAIFGYGVYKWIESKNNMIAALSEQIKQNSVDRINCLQSVDLTHFHKFLEYHLLGVLIKFIMKDRSMRSFTKILGALSNSEEFKKILVPFMFNVRSTISDALYNTFTIYFKCNSNPKDKSEDVFGNYITDWAIAYMKSIDLIYTTIKKKELSIADQDVVYDLEEIIDTNFTLIIESKYNQLLNIEFGDTSDIGDTKKQE